MISNPNVFLAGGGALASLRNGQLVANEQALLASDLYSNETGVIANASALRHDEGIRYDREMLEVATLRLSMAQTLIGAGLSTDLGGLGTILSYWQRSGDMTGADVDMSGATRAGQNSLTFDEVGVPIPIFHKEFYVDHRRLLMARAMGAPIDTQMIGISTRIVSQEFETHLFAGLPNLRVGGSQVYGLLTHPDRNTITLTASWVTTTADNILLDVERLATACYNDLYLGPYILVVAKDIWLKLQRDYSANKGDNTILDRIKANSYIKDVQVADYLTNGNVVMFQATKDVVDIAIAQAMTTIPWQTSPLQTEYKVMMAGAIRVKSEITGKSGICHGAP